LRITARDGSRYAAGPLAVLAGVNIVDALDVSILRGVLPFLEDEWGLSDFQLGLLSFAFVFVHAIAAIPAGWAADRVRRTRLIGWTVMSWGLLCSLSATAVGFWHLFGARAMLGFGQAIDDPASTSLLTDFYPAKVRGRVFSVNQIAQTAGTGIGVAIGGVVGATVGWRWAFLVVGIPGMLLAIPAFRLREPIRGEAEGATAELAVNSFSRGTSAGTLVRTAARDLRAELRMIFAIPTMRYVLVGVGTLLFTVSGTASWLVVYHDRYSNMSAGRAAAVTGGILALGGLIGTWWGGRLTDLVYGRVSGGRILVVGWSIIICTGFYVVSYNVSMVPLRLLLQFVGTVSITAAFPALRASMMDVVPTASRGVGTSAFSLASALFGTALAPPLVGLLSDFTSLYAAFHVIIPPVILGALIVLRARGTVDRDAAALMAAAEVASAEADVAQLTGPESAAAMPGDADSPAPSGEPAP
jgi:MFS family permease